MFGAHAGAAPVGFTGRAAPVVALVSAAVAVVSEVAPVAVDDSAGWLLPQLARKRLNATNEPVHRTGDANEEKVSFIKRKVWYWFRKRAVEPVRQEGNCGGLTPEFCCDKLMGDKQAKNKGPDSQS
jgi:hypothetical protein